MYFYLKELFCALIFSSYHVQLCILIFLSDLLEEEK